MGFLTKMHNRLITLVVGKKSVVMNVSITNHGVEISGNKCLVTKCLLDGTK